jgi:hypothetical protein
LHRPWSQEAIARRLAENGATQKMIKSVGGWSNDREVAISHCPHGAG